MRETFPHKSEGDTLGAGHVNKLNAAARAVMSLMPGSYTLGQGHSTAGLQPFVQRLVTIVDIEGESSSSVSSESSQSLSESSSSASSSSQSAIDQLLYDVQPLYFDHDDNKWKVNSDDGPYDLDSGPFALTFNVGDVLVAYWEPERDAFVPVLSAPTPVKRGFLLDDLPAAQSALEEPVAARLEVYVSTGTSGEFAGTEHGVDLVPSGERIPVVNRMTGTQTIPKGTWMVAMRIDGEYNPIAADCVITQPFAESSSSSSSSSSSMSSSSISSSSSSSGGP